MLATAILRNLPASGELKLQYGDMTIVFTRVDNVIDYSLRVTSILNNQIANNRDFIPIVQIEDVATEVAESVILQSGEYVTVDKVIADIKELLNDDEKG